MRTCKVAGHRVAGALTAVVGAMPLLLAAIRAQDVAGARVVPIQVTGDPAARFSMVVLGDGYTAAELPKFRAHVDKHLNILWSIEPFRSYRSYINVYAVESVSAESGITCDPEIRQQKSTALNMHFREGCTNPTARGILVDDQAARAYAAAATPHYDQILVIANTDTYGGIGGTVATTSGGNALGPLITPHELGHSLGRLQDEYTYSVRGKPGGPYTGPEPDSIHLTRLTEQEMRRQRKKWWRWLGEPSEAGGVIARFEGGASRTTGIWRPSRHSMMISVGYYFDQVARERMTQRISEQVALIADSTPTDSPVGSHDVVWLDTAQPVYHELDVMWQLDGREIPRARNTRHLQLGSLAISESSTLTATVVDPTPFVRDPEIRAQALTATRSWQVVLRPSRAQPVDLTFAASTQTERPVGGRDVIHVVTANPADRVLDVSWLLNGKPVPHPANARTLPLARYRLAAGTHRVAARVSDPGAPDAPPGMREWSVDNVTPAVAYALSQPVASIQAADGSLHHFVRDEFTMKLDATDDQPGYVVAEFRVNGDGWHHYYGWPDAPPGTPFRFTPRGTTIKELVYGSLGSEGLSPRPWERREPGWGTHRIEYRGIDAAGNVGAPQAFRVTILASPKCSRTITTPHEGALRIAHGVVCLDGASVSGAVNVGEGASLVAVNARLNGPLHADRAATLELINTTATDLRIQRARESVLLFGSTVLGELVLSDNHTRRAMLLVGNTVRGPVECSGNGQVPAEGGAPNVFERGATGRCR